MSPSLEIPQTPETKLPSVRESLDNLKNNVEATEKAREFLKGAYFDLEVETRVDGMYLPPKFPHRKMIYERMMFGQKASLKVVLAAELQKLYAVETEDKKVDPAEAEKKAREITEAWFDQLARLDTDKNGKLNYQELVPKNEKEREFIERLFGTAPFFIEMQNNELFKNRNSDITIEVKEDVEAKKEFVQKYIINFCDKLIDPKTNEATPGSGRTLAQLLEAMCLGVVGGGFLTNQDFAEAWREISESEEDRAKSVAAIFAEGEKQGPQNKFEKLLTKKDVVIRQMRVDADKNIADLRRYETKGNPHGLTVRQFGDGTSILLYYGSNILFAAIGLNIVMSRFNPEKMLKNPVLWGVTGLAFLAQKKLDPEFMSGTPPLKKNAQLELKEKFQQAHPAVKEWIALFSSSDLSTESGLFKGKQRLGMMLTEKNRTQITSAELVPFLTKGVIKPDSEIVKDSSEARQLFLFLRACKQRDLSPKKLANA